MIDHSIFRVAAEKIGEELDTREFYTDNVENTRGLVDKISQIIEETILGNTNYSHADAPAHEIDGDGWEGDLQNQISWENLRW